MIKAVFVILVEKMNKEKIILSIYNNEIIKSYCKNIVKAFKNYEDWEELFSELIIQLYKMPEGKLFRAYNCNYLEYISLTICKRITIGNISGTGIFEKKHKFGELGETPIQEDEYNYMIDDMLNIIENMHWYNQTIIKFYLEGYNMREISEKTGINIKSISYSIQTTKKTIKIKLKEKYGENFNDFK